MLDNYKEYLKKVVGLSDSQILAIETTPPEEANELYVNDAKFIDDKFAGHHKQEIEKLNSERSATAEEIEEKYKEEYKTKTENAVGGAMDFKVSIELESSLNAYQLEPTQKVNLKNMMQMDLKRQGIKYMDLHDSILSVHPTLPSGAKCSSIKFYVENYIKDMGIQTRKAHRTTDNAKPLHIKHGTSSTDILSEVRQLHYNGGKITASMDMWIGMHIDKVNHLPQFQKEILELKEIREKQKYRR